MKRIFIIALLGVSLQGCFTGVESTPKITYSDVKKENIVVTPEQRFLSDVSPEPPAQWTTGKKFFVTDPKISIIFTSATGDVMSLAGQDIYFKDFKPYIDVTGDTVTNIEFTSPTGALLVYRDNMPYSEIATRQQLSIPFTIEESMVEAVRNLMLDQRYYVVTPLWYNTDGTQTVNGLRHVPVDIVQIEPGNAVYPLRVIFKQADATGDQSLNSMYMTIGTQRSATRNFHTLFAFENPRKKYPRISDEVWNLIVQSRVQNGMTRDECRLALGAPQTIGQRPTTAGMVEYWSYADGIFLLFEEGYLAQYRR